MAYIDPQDLADEMYKMDTPYYEGLSEKEKHDIAYKNAVMKASERERTSQMDSLSSILRNTQSLPQFSGMAVQVEPDPMKRQQILKDQEAAMIAKQNVGGTFTNEDMMPYMRAGIQSQGLGNMPTQVVNPQQMAGQFVDAVKSGVDPEIAKAAMALSQKPEGKWEDWGYGQKRNSMTGQIEKIPVKPEEDKYQIVDTDQGLMRVNKNNPQDITPLGLRKKMTAEQQDTVEKIQTLGGIADNLSALYKPEYTGKLQGGISGKVREWTGLGMGDQEASFRSQTAELIKAAYALSGKQISVQEMERLKPFIPQVDDSDIMYTTKLDNFRKELSTILDRKMKLFKGEMPGSDTQAPAPKSRFTIREIP